MDKDIRVAVSGDETVPLVIIEPFDLAFDPVVLYQAFSQRQPERFDGGNLRGFTAFQFENRSLSWRLNPSPPSVPPPANRSLQTDPGCTGLLLHVIFWLDRSSQPGMRGAYDLVPRDSQGYLSSCYCEAILLPHHRAVYNLN